MCVCVYIHPVGHIESLTRPWVLTIQHSCDHLFFFLGVGENMLLLSDDFCQYDYGIVYTCVNKYAMYAFDRYS